MPQKNSPPPTPVSSPRVSPTPPGSPSSPGASAVDTASPLDPSADSLNTPQPSHGLSPTSIPLRPVHAPLEANAAPSIITVDPAPTIIPSSDDMDIDDSGTPSPNGSPMRNNANNGNSDDNSNAGSDADWSADDWMVDMRRVKARLPTPSFARSFISDNSLICFLVCIYLVSIVF